MVRDESQANLVWLRGRFEFGTTFSYRLPDASSQFAIGAPIPSPAAVKLALVASAIQEIGDPQSGARVLEVIRQCPVWFGLPSRIARFRAFIKRLKPKDSGGFLESTGMRDYFLFNSVFEIYLQVSESVAQDIGDLLRRVRRFGTTDSLCWCHDVDFVEPALERCAVPFRERKNALTERDEFIMISLLDLNPDVTFELVNPYREGLHQGDPFVRVPYVLPLRLEASGGNWALLTSPASSVSS